MTAISGEQPGDETGRVDPPLGDPYIGNLGNVVPLLPAGQRAAHRQVVGTGQDPSVEQLSVAPPRAIPIFGSATWHLPEWPTVLVLAGVLLGLVVVMLDSVTRGSLVLAAALLLAFFFRLVLNDRDAGALKVRNRAVDLVVLGSFTVALTVFAFWVPAIS